MILLKEILDIRVKHIIIRNENKEIQYKIYIIYIFIFILFLQFYFIKKKEIKKYKILKFYVKL